MNTLDLVLKGATLEPRPYQPRIVKKAVKMFRGEYVNGSGRTENPAKSVMVESPTGSGKTAMGLVAARVMQIDTGCDVAWVCMRKNLLRQAAIENGSPEDTNGRGKNIGVQAEYISMFTRELPSRLLPSNRGGRPLLLVHDEAIHDAANSSVHIHNQLRPEFVLGLSAYPIRTDSVKLCFEKVVKDIGIRELISQGWLSQYDHYTIPEWKPEQVADFYAMDPTRWGSSLAFFLTHDQCRRFSHRLTDYHGIPTDVVTGNTDRDQQTLDLAEGRVACLASCAVLSEGFDFPGLKTVFVRDSGRGCTTQMAGRVFRKHTNHPVKQLVQSKMTRWPFLKTAMPIQQFVWENGGWLSLRINPMIEQISANTRFAIANSPQDIPDFIKKNSGGSGGRRRRRRRI